MQAQVEVARAWADTPRHTRHFYCRACLRLRRLSSLKDRMCARPERDFRTSAMGHNRLGLSPCGSV